MADFSRRSAAAALVALPFCWTGLRAQPAGVRRPTPAQTEGPFYPVRIPADADADLLRNGNLNYGRGQPAWVEGVVSDVDKATRTDRTGSLTLSFDRMRVNGRQHRIRESATQVFESGGGRDEAPTAGVGAGVGGIVGGIIGGVKGAVLGAAIGAGGAIAATEGKNVDLPAGSIIRIRMDSPVRVL